MTGLVGRAVRLSSEQGEGGAAAVAYEQGKEAKRSGRSLLASATDSTAQKGKRELLPVPAGLLTPTADGANRALDPQCGENSYSYQCHVSRNEKKGEKSALQLTVSSVSLPLPVASYCHSDQRSSSGILVRRAMFFSGAVSGPH